MLKFKTLVLSALYNLSDDQIEYQVRDRLSLMRFLGVGLGDRVPDARMVWRYRDGLAQAGKVEELFGLFDSHLALQGYIARGGQILDASIVPVPRNHNRRDENATVKKGEVPEEWKDEPARRSQKDLDARWTKKHGKSHHGTKNQVNVDRMHKPGSGAITSATLRCTTARRWITCRCRAIPGPASGWVVIVAPLVRATMTTPTGLKKWRPSCATAS